MELNLSPENALTVIRLILFDGYHALHSLSIFGVSTVKLDNL